MISSVHFSMCEAVTNDGLASLLQHAALKSTDQREPDGHVFEIFSELNFLFGSLIRVLNSQVTKELSLKVHEIVSMTLFLGLGRH